VIVMRGRNATGLTTLSHLTAKGAMFDRMKEAGRLGAAERRLKDALKSRGLDRGADVRLRPSEDGIVATILLGDNPDLDGAGARRLETELSALENIARATVVVSSHRSQPGEDRISRGHANPLALPEKPAAGKADATIRARPAKQRPGGAKAVIAVASGKGGVGKSTVAAHLALALARRGAAVGLLDLDIYGPSIPTLFASEGKRPKVEGGQILPIYAAGIALMSIGFLVDEEQALAWRGPMVMGAAKQLLDEVRWGPLDYIVIDTPPGTGDTHLTLLQRTRIDGVLIVTTPSPLALADVRRGASLFRKMNAPLIGVVENMATLPDGSRPFGPPLDLPKDERGMAVLASLPLQPALAGIIGQRAPDRVEAFDTLAESVTGRLATLDPGDAAQ
jgi:ATP-binding protein involved in chromosome partitioning